MTIDERIEALTARHESLSHSVELLQHAIADLTRAHQATEKTITKFGRYVTANMLNHEKRITALEISREDEEQL